MVRVHKIAVMNKWIFSAGMLSVLTLLLHVFGGGPEILVPVLESELSVELKAILSVVWHMVTAILALNALALFCAARPHAFRKPLVVLVSSQNLAFAALFVFYGLTRLGTLLPMPQWVIFIVLAGLALAGLRNAGGTDIRASKKAR